MTVGRPRRFSTTQALECAMRVFWRKGYDGASIKDLTAAMGIGSPSLYAAFGDKKHLFHAVLEYYQTHRLGFIEEALDAPTAREVTVLFLQGVVALATDFSGNDPPGSLLLQCGLSSCDAAVPAELAQLRAKRQLALRDRFMRAQEEGDLPPDVNPSTLASYLSTVSIGICVTAAAGSSREELLEVANLAFAAWPVTPPAHF